MVVNGIAEPMLAAKVSLGGLDAHVTKQKLRPPGPPSQEMTVLVDSDILIEVSRGRNAGVVSKWMDLSNSDAAVLYSPVSVAELWAGAMPNEYDH